MHLVNHRKIEPGNGDKEKINRKSEKIREVKQIVNSLLGLKQGKSSMTRFVFFFPDIDM